MSEKEREKKRCLYWENEAKRAGVEIDYYREELVKAHALIGRIVHQASERWDTVNLTKYYPTDNLHRKRTITNPGGNEK